MGLVNRRIEMVTTSKEETEMCMGENKIGL